MLVEGRGGKASERTSWLSLRANDARAGKRVCISVVLIPACFAEEGGDVGQARASNLGFDRCSLEGDSGVRSHQVPSRLVREGHPQVLAVQLGAFAVLQGILSERDINYGTADVRELSYAPARVRSASLSPARPPAHSPCCPGAR